MTTTSYIGDLFSGSSNPYSTPSYYYDTTTHPIKNELTPSIDLSKVLQELKTLKDQITYLQNKIDLQESHITNLNTRIVGLEKLNKIHTVEII